MKRILVVDDEESIVQLIKFNLERAGYEVTVAMDGVTAYEMILKGDFDFVVLDIMLPGMDGVEIVRRLRQEKDQTPILMLTAKDDEYDKVVSLELGADDYMTKPFSPRELVARIKALWRRSEVERESRSQKPATTQERVRAKLPDEKEEIITEGDLEINVDHFEVLVKGEPVKLTPKEFDLLVYFARRPGRILSRDHILRRVWDYEYADESRIVDVHVSHLRDKLEEDPKNPKYIHTIRGFGYRFGLDKDEH